MNLDDLMEVWRSQDASALHGVNETLLRLSLRQDEAKMQRVRRGWMWFTFVITALVIVDMARYLAIMVDAGQSGWDYAIPVVGAGAALLWVRLMYVRQRAQAFFDKYFESKSPDIRVSWDTTQGFVTMLRDSWQKSGYAT